MFLVILSPCSMQGIRRLIFHEPPALGSGVNCAKKEGGDRRRKRGTQSQIQIFCGCRV